MAFVEWMDAVSEFGQLPALTRQSRRTLFFAQAAPPPCLAHSRSRGLAKWRASMHKRQIGRGLRQRHIFGQAAVTATADTYAEGARGQKNMICCDDRGYA